jgi:phage baseplate assembly protein V
VSPVLSVPRVAVEVDGTLLALDDGATLGSVLVTQRLAAPTVCELAFLDPLTPSAPADRVAPGSRLRVGLVEFEAPLFDGEVTAVEHLYEPDHGHAVRIRGYDLLHRLRKHQEPTVRTDVSTEDLAAELAGSVGLGVDAAASGPTWPRIIQHDQSDLELLLDICERSGLFPIVREDTVHLLTLEGSGAPIQLRLGEELLEAAIEMNGDPATRSVTTVGWDPGRAEIHEGQASSARVGRQVSGDIPPSQVGGEGRRTLFDEATGADDQAQALAQAELDVRVAAEVVIRGVATGDPRLRPGARIDVGNVDPAVSGRYVLTEVRHRIDRQTGYLAEFSTEPPRLERRPRAAVAAPGIVASVDDPDGLGRVQVTLPSFGDLESSWMGVLSPGAGSGKGIVALPDTGDQVLVLMANEDPSRGVVLGGLYGADGPPDSGVVGGSVLRYSLLTSGGHSIKLDDESSSIRVEDSQGSYVELTPEVVRIHSVADLEIEAPGRAIRIKATSVDFETG